MRIVVLCGPPCAGKTTLAHHLAGPDDQVLDYDVIAQALGSPTQWQHQDPWRTQAEQEMQHRIAAAYYSPSTATAWVIRTAPRAGQRMAIAQQWEAQVYLLNPGEAECRHRAKAAGRPSGTGRSIGEWYHRYRPWSEDRDPVDLDPTWVGVKPVTGGVVQVDPWSV